MAATIVSSSSSSSSSSHKYDAFLSFRGRDTRKNFTSHLHTALCEKKILAYMDHQLKSGEEISSTLLTAIEESKISIVIFSKNYATSRWCLDELVHIMECKEERNHIVLPVFYRVDPSDVRHQKGSYDEKHYKKNHTNTNTLQQWKKALTAAANLSGPELKHNESLDESTFVKKVVQKALDILNNIPAEVTSDDSMGLVGIEKRFEKIKSLLQLDCSDVRVIGIWGMRGIGKTTLAQTVYDRFFNQFEGFHFAKLREELSETELDNMKRRLFSDLLNDKNLDPMHSSFANQRLRRKKVLVVLDNVNERQLEWLVGDNVPNFATERFGIGSRIILTGRDKKLLIMARAHVIYDVEALDFEEARKLFHRKAFGEDSTHFKSEFEEIYPRIVNYAQGNPSDLRYLGSHLRHKSIKEWESVLVKLEEAPNKEIEKVLKISYNALDEGKKATCLDIGTNILVEKSLVNIMHGMIRQMALEFVRGDPIEIGQHSLLCYAHDVSYALKNSKGSALTVGIFLDVSKMHEGLSLTSTAFEDMCNLRILKIHKPDDGENYSKLIINIPQGLQSLPRSLRYLVWPNYSLNSLASNFESHNPFKLGMYFSKVKQLWSGVQNLGNIKGIDLSFCEELRKLVDLTQAPKIQNYMPATTKHLNLRKSSIETFPSSFESLENLKSPPKLPRNIKTFNLLCRSLESLPSNVWTLKLLKMFKNYNCSRLKYLPQIPEVAEHINLDATRIQELPSSVENLVVLHHLDLNWCEILKFVPKDLSTLSHLSRLSLAGLKLGCFPPMLLGFHSLTTLEFGYCNISEIPDWFGSLSSLTKVDIRGNNFHSIHPCIRQLQNLKYLNVSRCKNLRHVLELRASVENVEASECLSLEIVENSSNGNVNELAGSISCTEDEVGFLFFNCLKMDWNARDNVLINFLTQVLLISTTESEPSSDPLTDFTTVRTCYPGDRIPKWFSNQCQGSTATIKLPPNWLSDNFFGFATCVALEFDDRSKFNYLNIDTTIYFKTDHGTNDDEKDEVYDFRVNFINDIIESMEKQSLTIRSDHVFIWYPHNANKFREKKLDGAMEALFDFSCHLYSGKRPESKKLDIKVKSCGIRMIYLPEAKEDLYSSIASASSNGCHISEEPEPSTSNEPEPSGAETNCSDADESPMHRVNKCFDFFGCLPFLSILTGNI